MRTNITDKWERKDFGMFGEIATDPNHIIAFFTGKNKLSLDNIVSKMPFFKSGLEYGPTFIKDDFMYDKKMIKEVEYLDPGGEWLFPNFMAPALYRVGDRIWFLAPTWDL